MTATVTTEDFNEKVLNNKNTTLVDFWAPWCGPCQTLIPILEELSQEVKPHTQVYKINIDEEPQLAADYEIMSIPTIKIFKNGKVVEEATGVHTKQQLLEKLKKC